MANSDHDEKVHDYATKKLEAEVELFWKRSLFFWGFVAAAFVAYGVLFEKDDNELPLVIACFGLVCSVAWTLANRASRRWQDVWLQQVETVQPKIFGSYLFAFKPKTKGEWWGPSRYSVTKLAIALSDFTALVWLVLIVKATPLVKFSAWTCVSIAVILITFLYLLAMLIGTRSAKSK